MGGVARYWREIPHRYNLIGKRCGLCGTVYFPPRPICPTCRRNSLNKMENYQLAGSGTVESFTIIRAPPPEFEGMSPYIIALIRMDEGCYLTGQIVDCNLEDIDMGTRVMACFRRIQQDGADGAIYYGYKFKKAKKK